MIDISKPLGILDQLVDAAEGKFDLGYADSIDGHYSRAEAAADLVRRGKVKYLGEQKGDRWEVDGKQCSIRRRSCECLDRYAPAHAGGKLCKHRLAAMFAKRLEDTKRSRLDDFFANATGDCISVRASVIFNDGANGRDIRINGLRNGGKWNRFRCAEEWIEIDADRFNRLAAEAGWEIDIVSSQPGLDFVYTLRPISSVGAAKPARTLNSYSVESLDRRRFNDYAQAMQAS